MNTRSRSLRGLLPPLLLAAALLAGWTAAPAAAQPDSPPVLLLDSLVLTPPEAAGTGLAPEVEVRVTVDERGRVAAVEALAVKPASELDELFRQAVEETVKGWRYAPARAGGEPVAATLEWVSQFRAKEERTAAEGHGGGLPLSLTSWDEEDLRSRILALPPERQAAHLRQLAGIAEQHLTPGRRQRFESDRVVLVTDAAQPEAGEIVTGNLEAAFHLLDELLGSGVEPQPERYKVIVYLFQQHQSFVGLASAISGQEWPAGLYAAPGLLSFHLQAPTSDILLHTLLHEAVHAWTDRRLARPGFALPTWISEGLAEYVGNSEVKKGRLLPGHTPKGRYVLDQRRGGAFRVESEAAWTLDRVKQSLRKGEAPALGELLAAAPSTFYSNRWASYYPLSWLLVHYLRHGQPGWAEKEFPELLLYLAEGYPSEAALEAVYGVGPEELEEPFRAYVKGF